MKDFKGTPGPWNYCADEPDWVTDSNDNIAVARVTRYNADAEVQHANAKLIAAAPELLEALQETIHEIGHWLSTQKPELKEKIESAINKALGE